MERKGGERRKHTANFDGVPGEVFGKETIHVLTPESTTEWQCARRCRGDINTYLVPDSGDQVCAISMPVEEEAVH